MCAATEAHPGAYSLGDSASVASSKGRMLGGPAVSPLSLRCLTCPVKRMKQTQDDPFAFQSRSALVCFESPEEADVSKLWRRARGSRLCPAAVSHPVSDSLASQTLV